MVSDVLLSLRTMALKRPLEVGELEPDTLRVPKLVKLNGDKFQKVCLKFVLVFKFMA